MSIEIDSIRIPEAAPEKSTQAQEEESLQQLILNFFKNSDPLRLGKVVFDFLCPFRSLRSGSSLVFHIKDGKIIPAAASAFEFASCFYLPLRIGSYGLKGGYYVYHAAATKSNLKSVYNSFKFGRTISSFLRFLPRV